MADRRQEAFRAGYENPLIGDISPLQRLYGTVQAIGSEIGGGDMGTPFGQKFAERQKMTKAEVKRLQDLRAKYPEEFGRGMMQSADVQDPYMFGLGLGTTGAMRTPTSAARYTPSPAEAPDRTLALPAPNMRALPPPANVPMEAYYRNIPPEMGTSARPMNAYNQNMYGMTTGRYGPMGAQYMPEMAVTDFETYAPGGMGRTTSGPTPIGGFDQNMLDTYRRRAMGFGQRSPVGVPGADYTPEEMGSAMVPYRQGGLVYEPITPQDGPRQVGYGGQPARRLGYERGPIEGQWSEVYGLEGPARQPYAGGMDFGVTREGQAMSPSGMRFDPRVAAGAAGLGYMAGLPREQPQAPMGNIPAWNPNIPVSGMPTPSMSQIYPVMPSGATALSGQAPGAGTAFEAPAAPAGRVTRPAQKAAGKAKGKGAEKAAAPAEATMEPNLNYYVTQALDRLLGQDEANRGLHTQQYYATNPWPY